MKMKGTIFRESDLAKLCKTTERTLKKSSGCLDRSCTQYVSILMDVVDTSSLQTPGLKYLQRNSCSLT